MLYLRPPRRESMNDRMEQQEKNYNKTLIACYLGFVTQAITANFAPLLFLTFKGVYNVSLEQIALIPFTFYLTQLFVDLVATKYADKLGYRACVAVSQVVSALGLVLMVVLPDVLGTPFAGIIIAVVLYAIGSGLIEVLVSPVVEACPFKNKDGMMSLLHSFYCWGAVAVILGSTIFFAVFGVENWKILALVWAAIPLYNTFNFLTCPIERLPESADGNSTRKLLRLPLFWLLIVLMVCSGASEATMAQWSSAFTESALGVSKSIGDLAGPCMFAAFMGVSRLLYGKMSTRLNLVNTMLTSGVVCSICYFVASLAALPFVGLAGCALCGLAVGIMWPGSISISAQKCSFGGTALFAFLALAGDLGATVSPALVGYISGLADGNLKTGLLVASAFPILLVICLLIIKSIKHNNADEGNTSAAA